MAKEKSVYDRIKKQNGEAFAKAIRNYDSGIFEIEGIVDIVKYAGRNAVPIMGFLRSLKKAEEEKHGVYEEPLTLLKKAGYHAFIADTEEKKNSTMNYYGVNPITHRDEHICTFKDPARHINYHIVHAIKEGADKLKREDFSGKEEREDEYGTSVISIQILKKGGFISIKNRYNHTVEGCDNTFNSNPDNIILGLSDSLKRFFGVDFSTPVVNLPVGYTFQNNRIIKYHKEFSNVYFGNGFYVRNGTVVELNKDAQIMVDTLILDLKTKKVIVTAGSSDFTYRLIQEEIKDKKLQIKTKDGCKILYADGQEVLKIKEGQIISLTTRQEDLGWGYNFLSVSDSLEEFIAPNMKKLFGETLYDCPNLKYVHIPACEEIDRSFLRTDSDIQIEMPKLNEKGIFHIANLLVNLNPTGQRILNADKYDMFHKILEEELAGKQAQIKQEGDLTYLMVDGIPLLTAKEGKIIALHLVETKVIDRDKSVSLPLTVESLTLDNVEVLPDDVLNNYSMNRNLKHLSAKNLRVIGNHSLSWGMESLDLPNVEKIGACSIREFKGKRLDLPNLVEAGNGFLCSFETRCVVNAPKLERVVFSEEDKDRSFCSNCELLLATPKLVSYFLRETDLNNTPLKVILNNQFNKAKDITVKRSAYPQADVYMIDNEPVLIVRNNKVKSIFLKGVERLPAGVIQGFKHLEEVHLQNTKEMMDGNVRNCPSLKTVSASELKKVGDNCFANIGAERLLLPALEEVGHYSLCENDKLEVLSAENLQVTGEGFLHQTEALRHLYTPQLKNRLQVLKKHKNYRLLLQDMDQMNVRRDKKPVSYFRAMIYKDGSKH